MKKVGLLNVSKSYDGHQYVIHEISVSIETGEFFVLVGPSGCGKSTMLRMIAGLESISEGEIWIEGRKANHLLPHERDISMVFQNYALFPHLTVEKNIRFGLHTKKISKQEQKRRCQEAAEMLGLTELLDRKPRELSGGQRQRVALARAIVTQSSICLMDEPLSNLDAKLRAKMRSEIRQIQRQLGITMIYVTHDQIEAMTMADRMMVLNKGEIQQIGRPLDIYNRPANTFVASFIGSPPMNLAKVKFEGNVLIFEDGRAFAISEKVSKTVKEKDLLIGIRPEAIRLARNGENAVVVTTVNSEILGTETFISFQMANVQWVARWNGQWNIPIGKKIPIVVNEQDIFLFSAKNGQRLYSSPQEKSSFSLEEEILL